MSAILPRPSFQKIADLARFLYTQRIKGFDPPRQPLLDEQTLEWLAERLRSTKLYLEFGSGGSTILANRLGLSSITVESDRFYAAVVRKNLPFPEKARIITPNMGITGAWGMPVVGRERKGPRYVCAPFAGLGDTFPDLIFVDGRYRVACVLESARQATEAQAIATVLLDDYQVRPAYHILERYLGDPVLIGRAAKFVVGQSPISHDDVRRHISNPC